MALDQAYFDAISIELVKKKYYNANKVEAVFEDIQREAQDMNEEIRALRNMLAEEQVCLHELSEENEALKRELSRRTETREELTDAVCSAQGVYRVILEKANERADAILSDAEERRRSLDAADRRQRDYAVKLVEACLSRVRRQQQAALDELNASWQAFLCGLSAEEETKPAEEPKQEEVPEDLDARIKAIARELFAIEDI